MHIRNKKESLKIKKKNGTRELWFVFSIGKVDRDIQMGCLGFGKMAQLVPQYAWHYAMFYFCGHVLIP